MGASAPIKLSPPKLARMGVELGEDLKSERTATQSRLSGSVCAGWHLPRIQPAPFAGAGNILRRRLLVPPANKRSLSLVHDTDDQPRRANAQPTSLAVEVASGSTVTLRERRTSTNIRLPTDDNTRVSQKLLTNFAVSASGVGRTFGSGPQSTMRRCRRTCNRSGSNACLAVSRH